MVDGAPLAHRAGSFAEDRIAFMGHATVLIELDGVRLLTDPLLRDRVAHLRRQTGPIDPDLTTMVDAVLLSHLHRDHLDLASLRLLGRDTPLLAPSGTGPWLGRRGFTHVSELRAGETADVGRLEVRAVEARHDGHRHPGGRRAEALGYLVRGSRSIYFAGDTALFEGMAALGDVTTGPPGRRVGSRTSGAYRLDVALVPVAGWGPKLGPGHMDPLEAARAVSMLVPRLAIPIHWGTLLPLGRVRRHRDLLRDPPRLFARHVARLAPSVEVRILEPGQQMALERS
ncbi:MAG TPA: MBL fold metallo-hydrolase [Solirubrobacteraceae bacterium]|jgi:L-ascorbate metabolism protein UlaG (beta-lactamase superfamily)